VAEAGRQTMPSPSSDDLFDRWLDAALAGRIEDPGAFCERHRAAPELRLALERIHAQLVAAPPPTPPPDPGESPLSDLDPAAPGSERDVPFETLGGFRLLRTLGRGGMGTVYLAEDAALDRLVAVKVLRPEYLGSPSAEARFAQEARAVARLRHPHVVTLLGAGEDRGVRFLVMELVPGRGLDEVFADGPVPAHQLLRWAHQVAEALACAHGEGIVHRDVKPSNIRIDPSGRAVLLDFGLARDLLDVGPTRTRSFAGSPQYASPEQRAEDRARMDHRTDVYSLGVVLYEGLSGALPYAGSTLESVVHEAAVAEPVPLRKRNPRVARDVAVVVGKAMERDPADRYATMAAMGADLLALLELRPIHAQPPSALTSGLRWARRHRAVVGAVAVMAVALGAVVAWGLHSAAEQRQARRGQAVALVDAARQEIAAYATRRDSFARQASNANEFVAASKSRYLTPDEHAFLQLHSLIRARHWGSSDALFATLLRKLQSAQDLDPTTPGIDEVWAEFWFQRWWDLQRSPEWSSLAAFYRARIEEADREGHLAPRLRGAVTVSIESDPAGAEVHLFRFAEQAEVARLRHDEPETTLYGDRRLVPVAIGGDDVAAPLPGSMVLRVGRGGGDVRAGDVVVEVQGVAVAAADAARLEAASAAVPVTVWRGGARVAGLAHGLRGVRASVCQPFAGRRSRLGPAPVDGLPIEPGEYVAVLTKDGFERLALPFVIPHRVPEEPLHRKLAGRLLPAGSTPEGFVRVSDARGRWPGVWMQEREVTCGEYLEFLDRRGVVAADGFAGNGWSVGEDRKWRMPPDATPDQPAVGVSWYGAAAYAEWWNENHEFVAAGVRYTARLPTRREWRRAAGAVTTPARRAYPFGDYFGPHWCSNRFSRPESVLSAGMSYPIDESIYGAFDMAGSAAEWCSGFVDEARGQRPMLGGSWQDGPAELFRVDAVRGADPATSGPHTGFRLVWAP